MESLSKNAIGIKAKYIAHCVGRDFTKQYFVHWTVKIEVSFQVFAIEITLSDVFREHTVAKCAKCTLGHRQQIN